MNLTHPSVRLLAVILVAVLVFTLATPARAEALEPLTILAIAGLAVVVVVIIAYLIIANVGDSRRAGPQLRYMACAESEAAAPTCWSVSDAAALTPTAEVPQG
jgi:hypothetical protein